MDGQSKMAGQLGTIGQTMPTRITIEKAEGGFIVFDHNGSKIVVKTLAEMLDAAANCFVDEVGDEIEEEEDKEPGEEANTEEQGLREAPAPPIPTAPTADPAADESKKDDSGNVKVPK